MTVLLSTTSSFYSLASSFDEFYCRCCCWKRSHGSGNWVGRDLRRWQPSKIIKGVWLLRRGVVSFRRRNEPPEACCMRWEWCTIASHCHRIEKLSHNCFQTLQSQCPPNSTLIEFTRSEKKVILSLHNKIRNFIASGNHSSYKPAAKMQAIEWDKSLAFVSSFNVRTCEFQHDSCRNTSKFNLNLLPLPSLNLHLPHHSSQ